MARGGKQRSLVSLGARICAGRSEGKDQSKEGDLKQRKVQGSVRVKREARWL